MILADNQIYIFAAGISVALAASYLGAFVIVKRMALLSDILSHVALPGMALGLIFHFDPIFGALAFLITAVTITWFLEQKTLLTIEAIIGVFFTATLAIGVILIPHEELIESLFGNLFSINQTESLIIVLGSILIFIFTILISRRLTLSIISPELSKSIKANPNITYLIFLLLFASSVALGIKFVGSLLMGALTILPATAARNFSWSFNSFLVSSVIIGVITMVLGIFASGFLGNYPPGPIIVLVGIAFFCVSLLFKNFANR